MHMYNLFLAKLRGERKSFWSGQAWIYHLNYLLHARVMLTIIKVLPCYSYSAARNREHPDKYSKQISKLSFQLSVQVSSLLSQTEEQKKAFFEGCKKGGCIVRLLPRAFGCQKKWKVCLFLKFEIILPILCYVLDPDTNNKFLERFQDLSKVQNPVVSKVKV